MREAALWLARLDSGSADPAEFEAWRDADPRRSAAVARLVGVNAQLDRVRPLVDPEAIGTDNAHPDHRRRRWLVGSGVAATLALAAGSAPFLFTRKAHAETGVGDRQILSLPDGASLDLNTDSKVAWRFDKQARTVWLERGEIALALPSGSKPCRIVAGTAQATFTDGKVNARLTASGLRVLVEKGRCMLRTSNGRTMTVIVNQVAAVRPGGLVVRPALEAERQFTTGWQDDELILDGQTLAEAVDEFNRYQVAKIEIADPSLADIRLGGRFSLRDQSAFLRALSSGFPISSEINSSGNIVLSRTS